MQKYQNQASLLFPIILVVYFSCILVVKFIIVSVFIFCLALEKGLFILVCMVWIFLVDYY